MFIFWTLWPYIVASTTRKMCQRYTGKRMTQAETAGLRRNLAQIRKRD